MRRLAASLRLAACARLAGWLLAAAALPGAAQAEADPSAAPDGAERLLARPQDVASALRRCWTVPEGLRKLERIDVTVRFSLRADGTLIGRERVSFSTLATDTRSRALLVRSAMDAVEACLPFRLEPGLGQAVAGRLFAIRLVYRGPTGQGA